MLFLAASLLIAGALLPRRIVGRAGQLFSGGLLAFGLAAAIWAYAAIDRATQTLDMFLWASLLVGFVGLLFFAGAAVSQLSRTAQEMAVLVTFIASVLITVVAITYPASPAVASSGLIFSNFHSVVQFLLIVLLGATVVPASLVTARQFAQPFAGTIFLLSLLTLVLGGVVLLITQTPLLVSLMGGASAVAALLLVKTSIGLFEHPTTAPTKKSK